MRLDGVLARVRARVGCGAKLVEVRAQDGALGVAEPDRKDGRGVGPDEPPGDRSDRGDDRLELRHGQRGERGQVLAQHVVDAVAVAIVALHGGATGGAAVGHGVEQGLGRLAAHDQRGDGVGVLLVGIAAASDAAVEADAAALLDHVGGLVRGLAQIRRGRERHVVPGRVGAGADRAGCLGGRAADVGAHARHVVMAEALLDRLGVRQWSPAAGDAVRGEQVDRERIGIERRAPTRRVALHRWRAAGGLGLARQQPRGERHLARGNRRRLIDGVLPAAPRFVNELVRHDRGERITRAPGPPISFVAGYATRQRGFTAPQAP